MKRVFDYDKWKNDPLVQDFIEVQREHDKDIDKWVENMKRKDGKPAKELFKGSQIAMVDNNPIHMDWTTEVESDPLWKHLLIMGGLAIAFFLIGVGGCTVIDHICGV